VESSFTAKKGKRKVLAYSKTAVLQLSFRCGVTSVNVYCR